MYHQLLAGPTLATVLRPKGGKTCALLCSHHVLPAWPF